MKKSAQSHCGRFPSRTHSGLLALLFAALLSPAGAQSPAPLADATVTLPDGWKSSDVHRRTGAGPFTDQTELIQAASPGDAKQAINLSLYRVVVRQGDPVLSETGPVLDEEKKKLVESVMMQGYSPGQVKATVVPTGAGKRMITIEVPGDSTTSADSRVFWLVAPLEQPVSGMSYRLYLSFPYSDGGNGLKTATGIVNSFRYPDITALATATPAAPATTGSTAAVANAGAPATTAGSADFSAATSNLVQNYHSALVLVEGKKGVGSGFLCNIEGKTYVLTNAHVLSDNYGVKLTSIDGAAYTAGASAVAVGHDIVKMEVTAAPKAFDILPALDSTAKIGDAVVVLGNPEGGSVVHPVEGKIVGIGPNLVEVDAPFVHGNSGSPIIHVATGKVIGIATYLMQRKVENGQEAGNNGGKVVVETRRFGYRIDSVKQWEPINWQLFFTQSGQVADMEVLSDDFIHLFEDFRSDVKLNSAEFKNTTMSRVVKNFTDSVNTLHGSASKADRDDLVRRFFSDLRWVTKADITQFNSRPAYDYFRREVEDEARFRDQLYDIFSKIIQSHSD